MAKSNATSAAAQVQTADQVSSPGLTNGEIVSSTKMIIATIKGSDIINVQSSGNPYQKGKRADDGKTYSVIRTNINNSEVNKLLGEFVEDYNQTLSFIVCEQEHKQFVDAADAGRVDSFKLAVGLRLKDKEDKDSEILSEVNFLQGKDLKLSVEREKLELERERIESDKKIAQAKARFFDSAKADAVFSESLAKELQMKF
jgi:hypothetical protein